MEENSQQINNQRNKSMSDYVGDNENNSNDQDERLEKILKTKHTIKAIGEAEENSQNSSNSLNFNYTNSHLDTSYHFSLYFRKFVRFMLFNSSGIILFHFLIFLDSIFYLIKINNDKNENIKHFTNLIDIIFLITYMAEPIFIVVNKVYIQKNNSFEISESNYKVINNNSNVDHTIHSKLRLENSQNFDFTLKYYIENNHKENISYAHYLNNTDTTQEKLNGMNYIKKYLLNCIWLFLVLLEYFTPFNLRIIRYLRIVYVLNYIKTVSKLKIMLIGPLKDFIGIMLSIIYILLLVSIIFTLLYNAGSIGICSMSYVACSGKFYSLTYDKYNLYSIENERLPENLVENNTLIIKTLSQNKTEWNIRKFNHWNFNNNYCKIGTNYTCPEYSYCSDVDFAVENFFLFDNNFKHKYKDYITGNNVAKSFFYSFLIANMDGYEQFYDSISSIIPPYIVFIHWFFVIIFINFVLIKFPIGIMVNAAIVSETKNSKKDKIKEAILNEINQNASLENSNINYFELKLKVFERLKSLINIIKNFQYLKKIEPIYLFHKKWNFSFLCFYIYKQPITNIIMSIVSMINLFFLAFDTNMRGSTLSIFLKLIILLFYILNVIIILIGERTRIISNFNFLYTSFIILLSIIEFSIRRSIFVSCLQSFRAISFMFYLKELKTLGVAYRIIIATSKEVYKYCIITFIFIYYLMIVGQILYKDNLKYLAYNSNNELIDLNIDYSIDVKNQTYFYFKVYDEIRGDSPVLNFDNLYNSFITVFNLFIGDQWSIVFEDAYYSEKVHYIYTYIYFIFSIFLLKVWMANLALAIIIHQFENSRKANMFYKIFYEYTEKQKKLKLKRTHSFSFKSKIDLRGLLIDTEEELESSFNENDSVDTFKVRKQKHELKIERTLFKAQSKKSEGNLIYKLKRPNLIGNIDMLNIEIKNNKIDKIQKKEIKKKNQNNGISSHSSSVISNSSNEKYEEQMFINDIKFRSEHYSKSKSFNNQNPNLNFNQNKEKEGEGSFMLKNGKSLTKPSLNHSVNDYKFSSASVYNQKNKTYSPEIIKNKRMRNSIINTNVINLDKSSIQVLDDKSRISNVEFLESNNNVKEIKSDNMITNKIFKKLNSNAESINDPESYYDPNFFIHLIH